MIILDVISLFTEANMHLYFDWTFCACVLVDPMFGPDSGKNGWTNLNFVYEKTRINGEVLLDQDASTASGKIGVIITNADSKTSSSSSDATSRGEEQETAARVKGMDRMERFLSIWEEEGCRMIPMSCRDHDAFAANSQFM